MSEETEELSEDDECENQGGLILGCWDHEKTPTLIQDLEQSVTLVEKKCTQLFEELMCYKKFLEHCGETNFQLNIFKKKTKKSKKNSHFFSGSEPDIAFRKNLINFKQIQQVFERKFREQLCKIHEELREAAHKIGLKNNIILLHANDYLKGLPSDTEGDGEMTHFYLPEDLLTLSLCEAKTKSDPVIAEDQGEIEFSKITKNELELYQKLSRLSMNRGKRKKKLKGRILKFCLKKKTPRCDVGKTVRKKPKSKKRKLNKTKRTSMVHRREGCRSPRNSLSHSQGNLDESENEKLCKSLNEVVEMNKLQKSREVSREPEPPGKGNATLGATIKKAVPFTACASTSKSYNLGVNLQQLLFLSRQERKSNPKTELGRTGCWVPQSKNAGFENDHVSRVEHKRGLWISDNNKLNFRKARSKYTGTSPEGFVEYHKSTMSQYTNGRKSMIKSESKSAYAVGSKIMFSDCQRTDVFEVHRDDGCFENASGDSTFKGRYEKLNKEWMKVYNSFLSIYRKYTTLREKVSSDHLAHADGELESLENEIDYSIEKYKDFLQFYSKFLQLNHRLKSLKLTYQSKMFVPVTSFSSNFHRKFRSYRPTQSVTMKKALREVQALQEKIKLIEK